MALHLLKCLLVDDDSDDHEIFRYAVEQLNQDIEIVIAGNGKVGLDLLKADHTIDYIFLDLNMPVMNGKDFLKSLKSNPGLKNIPAYVLSTSASPIEEQETLKLGASAFITKPTSVSALTKALGQIFRNIY